MFVHGSIYSHSSAWTMRCRSYGFGRETSFETHTRLATLSPTVHLGTCCHGARQGMCKMVFDWCVDLCCPHAEPPGAAGPATAARPAALQVAVLGTGEGWMERAIAALSSAFPGVTPTPAGMLLQFP